MPNLPCGPILSMKEVAAEPSLRATGTVVDRPTRGKYLSVGNPSEATRSPPLGDHTEEILKDVLGLSDQDIAETRAAGAI